MIDLNDLGKSLDLRSVGRLMATDHPFFSQISAVAKRNGYFNVDISSLAVDKKLQAGIASLNEQRRRVLQWPMELVLSDPNVRAAVGNTELMNVLTRAGRNSLVAFRVRRRHRRITLAELTLNEVTDLSRHFAIPGLARVVEGIRRNPLIANSIIPEYDLYPLSPGKAVRLSSTPSKTFRTSMKTLEEQIICLYKSGLTLQPGEVMCWSKKVKKLTSTRHRNSVLRIAHGDVYTNERLFRFGLVHSA